jgi:hypothetical protein
MKQIVVGLLILVIAIGVSIIAYNSHRDRQDAAAKREDDHATELLKNNWSDMEVFARGYELTNEDAAVVVRNKIVDEQAKLRVGGRAAEVRAKILIDRKSYPPLEFGYGIPGAPASPSTRPAPASG